MPGRVNDPRDLEAWMVKIEQRLRQLEARRIDAAEGLDQDHATKQMKAKISEDDGNAAKIGEDGGIYAENTDTVTTAANHDPLIIQKFMTADASMTNGGDTLIVWSSEASSGTWSTTTSTITIPEDGWYHVNVHWPWDNNTTGTRVIHVTLNSTTVTTGSTMAAQSDPEEGENITILSDYRFFTAGDVLRVYGFQNSGTNPLPAGGPYFGDVRGRWTVAKWGDAYPPALEQTTE